MIKTFFGTGTLDTPWAFLAALVIGLLFGVTLERAGFGSSRRLTGVFYFTDTNAPATNRFYRLQSR